MRLNSCQNCGHGATLKLLVIQGGTSSADGNVVKVMVGGGASDQVGAMVMRSLVVFNGSEYEDSDQSAPYVTQQKNCSLGVYLRQIRQKEAAICRASRSPVSCQHRHDCIA